MKVCLDFLWNHCPMMYVSLCTRHITFKSFSCHGATKPGFMKHLTHGKERPLSHDDTGNTPCVHLNPVDSP